MTGHMARYSNHREHRGTCLERKSIKLVATCKQNYDEEAEDEALRMKVGKESKKPR